MREQVQEEMERQKEGYCLREKDEKQRKYWKRSFFNNFFSIINANEDGADEDMLDKHIYQIYKI